MSKTLITSRDPKGQQAVRVFEAAYDKAKLDDQRAQRLNEHPEFAQSIKQLIEKLSVRQHTPIDQWFKLEVDGNIDPMSVVTTAGCDAKYWEFLGPEFEGKKVLRVKLIELGHADNLFGARVDAQGKGYRLLEGQAREPLKQKIPRHDGRPIVFGGNEWSGPSRYMCVACLDCLDDGLWKSDFYTSEAEDSFNNTCLWAVVEQDA